MSKIRAFSVVLPVYFRDRPYHLKEALESLLVQTRPAAEIVVVEDGPIDETLKAVIEDVQKDHPEVKVIQLHRNSGLPSALNEGIKACTHEWIARMDADDVCTPDRFEKQIGFLETHPEVDIISSAIDEYDLELQHFFGRRQLPVTHEDIMKFAQWRSPFNHMAVVYRKSAVLEIGSYDPELRSGQDYELWSRLLTAGYRGANLPDVLIKARTGEDFYGRRRRGWRHLKNEWNLVGKLYQNGLFGWPMLWVHRLSKTFVRLLPSGIMKRIYGLMRSSS